MLPVRGIDPRPRRVWALHPFVSQRCRFHRLTSSRSLRGFPSSPTPLFLHATACGLRRTSTPSPSTGASVLPSVYVKTLGIRNKLISKLYQHFRVREHPYGLQDSLCTLAPLSVRSLRRSATGPTLDTGGWLTLTRPGLSPGKRRRALLGATTSKLTGAEGVP